MKKTLLYVGGAKGVGKTRLLSEFRGEHIKGRETYVTHVSDLLRTIAKEKFNGWVNLSDIEKSRIRLEAIDAIKDMKYEIIILDSHYVEFDKGEFRAIIPEEFKKEIKGHILIEADYSTILSRRINDKIIQRELNPDLINIEIVSERNAAKSIAKETNTPIFIINNNSIALAITEFRVVLESLV